MGYLNTLDRPSLNYHPVNMLFTLASIESRLEAIWTQWYQNHTRLEPALQSYFKARVDNMGNLSDAFFQAVQGMEALHKVLPLSMQRLKGENSFTCRMRELLYPVCPELAADYATRIERARVGLAHAGQGVPSAPTSSEMATLMPICFAAFNYHLLNMLDLDSQRAIYHFLGPQGFKTRWEYDFEEAIRTTQ